MDSARNAWGEEIFWGVSQAFNSGRKTDIAIVATPDDQHFDILWQLAGFPLKLVICEKPLCTDLAQARETVELYRARGIPLMVNYTRRLLPYYQELKRKWHSGELGGFIHGDFAFNRGWLHSGSHMVDFIRWLFEFGDEFIQEGLEIKHLPEAKYRVWNINLYFQNEHWREERIGDQPVWPYYDRAMWHVMDAAYEFLEGRGPIVCSGEDALRTLEICFKLMGR